MKPIMCSFLIITIAISTNCVRLPQNYAIVLENAVKTNEELLQRLENESVDKKLETYRIIIEEDNKTLKAAVDTIRKGGGN
jgi:hypothetical protein